MTDPPSHLTTALADRYRIERQGGMATVYLAEDLRHHRKAAVKVLRPELAATLGPDRFFREIEVAVEDGETPARTGASPAPARTHPATTAAKRLENPSRRAHATNPPIAAPPPDRDCRLRTLDL